MTGQTDILIYRDAREYGITSNDHTSNEYLSRILLIEYASSINYFYRASFYHKSIYISVRLKFGSTQNYKERCQKHLEGGGTFFVWPSVINESPSPFLLNIHIASPKKHNGPGAPLFQKCVPVENFDNFVDNLRRSVDFCEKKNQNIFKKIFF